MKSLTLSQFIDEVIPTRELQDAQTIADIRRIVANTPIFWDEQEYTQDEVITELWHNRTRYACMLTDAQIASAKADFLEYMQAHNKCGLSDMPEAAGKIAFDYANARSGVTYARLYEMLEECYHWLEEHNPDALIPDL